MRWSTEALAVIVGLGATAAVVTHRRGDAPEIWVTQGFFSLMEALQVWGYARAGPMWHAAQSIGNRPV